MSETSSTNTELPQIIVCNSSDAHGIDVDLVADGPKRHSWIRADVAGDPKNLHQAGATLESIQYIPNAEESDCIITVTRIDRTGMSWRLTGV